MSVDAIRAEGLGKQYRIGRPERYWTLRDALSRTMTAPYRWLRSIRSASAMITDSRTNDLFWALKDVSFVVPHGAVVGVIGRNGAGKSTLLKVLSRITEPSEGLVEIRGRVGSLLEVGTGFHPELTGRDNVFLNGAILGMRRQEIMRKFDEIVAFAEVERFIDTPVKHYSSGMYMRLAFAVAASLEPEILVIDEVLAVGDAKFQKKCLGKMSDVAREGRTVIFVSHSMASVAALCRTGLLLDHGSVVCTGPIASVIDRYASSLADVAAHVSFDRDATRLQDAGVWLSEACVVDGAGRPCSQFQNGDDVTIEFSFEAGRTATDQLCAVIVRTSAGVPVLHLMAHNGVTHKPLRISGGAKVRCVIPHCGLYPGTYTVSLWVGSSAHQQSDYRPDAVMFHMGQGELLDLGFDVGCSHGLVHVNSRWHVAESTDPVNGHAPLARVN